MPIVELSSHAKLGNALMTTYRSWVRHWDATTDAEGFSRPIADLLHAAKEQGADPNEVLNVALQTFDHESSLNLRQVMVVKRRRWFRR